MDFVIDVGGPGAIALTDQPVLANEITQWVSNQNIATPEYDKSFIEDPGVDGTLIKRGGYRTNKLVLEITYVGPNKAELLTQVRTDKIGLLNRALVVSIGTELYLGCEFESNSVEDTPRPMISHVGADGAQLLLYKLVCPFNFTSRQIGREALG